ncbi:MAG: hypothetical protein K2G88_04420, partial [Oscillospiraceae bacterium]|nr:hypothetical protein [Oscillospiraceae bacterium]
ANDYNADDLFNTIKNYDGNTLRIEQLNKYQQQDNDILYNLDELKQNNKLNIIYYGYGYYDKKLS